MATDVDAVGRLAARYFLQRGFRHFAYVSLLGLDCSSQQRDAFVGALNSVGYGCAEMKVKPQGLSQTPDWSLPLGQLASWLKTLPKPVAILTWNGGREIIHACAYAELAVPEQVALLSGSNDDCYAKYRPSEFGGSTVRSGNRDASGRSIASSHAWAPRAEETVSGCSPLSGNSAID